MSTAAFEQRLAEAGRELETKLIGRTILFAPSVESTNTVVLESGPGLDAGTVIVADAQTGGRGRHGRRWFSPAGRNLYFSIALRPDSLRAQLRLLPLAAGLAAVEAIEHVVGITAALKWPNDVIWNGRKLGGVLCENRAGALAVGVGLNVNLQPQELPPELAAEAVSLQIATGRDWPREQIFLAYLRAFEPHYDALCAGTTAPLLAAIRQRSCTLGQRVSAQVGKLWILGTAIEIADSGDLVVKRDDGGRATLAAGEVTHIR